MSATELQIWDRVQINGLQGFVELNGKQGTVAGEDRESGRIIVGIDGVGEKKLKPQNLLKIVEGGVVSCLRAGNPTVTDQTVFTARPAGSLPKPLPSVPAIYVLLGPPCSGKTTLGNALAKETGRPHIMASSLLKSINQSGYETSDSLQINAIMNRLHQGDCASGFFLDNFPRTVAQAKLLDEALQRSFNKGILQVFHVEVPLKVLEARAENRLVECESGMPINDEDAVGENELMRRSDDLPERYQHRLARYSANINDMLCHYGPERCCTLTGTLQRQEVLAQAIDNIRRTEKMQSRPGQITVETLAGQEFIFDVSNMSMVRELKERIQRDANIPIMEQRLLEGTREVSDWEPVPTCGRVTLVRQMEGNVYEQMRSLLRNIEDSNDSLRREVSSFSGEVASRANWTEDTQTQPCGCCTETKRYVGKDPPSSELCNRLCEQVSDQVQKRLNAIKQDDMIRHRARNDELLQQYLAQQGAFNNFTQVWHGCFFACCLAPPAPPHDDEVYDLEAECRRCLNQIKTVRSEVTKAKMMAATQIDATKCDVHKPPPDEPSSP
jgi:adenylate kinase